MSEWRPKDNILDSRELSWLKTKWFIAEADSKIFQKGQFEHFVDMINLEERIKDTELKEKITRKFQWEYC